MRCSVKYCANDSKTLREGHGITFHKFPRDCVLRKVWTEVLDIDKPEVNSAVCSDHFRSEDINITRSGLPRMKHGALPVVVQVCRICLATDLKMYSIRDPELRQAYADVCGIIIEDDKLKAKVPEKLCWECAARLLAGSRLRNRAITSHQLLTQLLRTTPYITLRELNSINRSENELESNLSLHHNEPDDCGMYIEEGILNKPDIDDNIMEIEEIESFEEDDFEEEYLEEPNVVEDKNEMNNDLINEYEFAEVSDEAEYIEDEREDSDNDECKVADENKMQVNIKDDDEQNDSNNRNEDSENDEEVLYENKMQDNNDDDGEQNYSNDRNEDSENDEEVLYENEMQVKILDDDQNDSNDSNEDSENDECRVLDETKMQVDIPDDDEQNDSNDRNEDSEENDELRVLHANKMQVNIPDDDQNDSNDRNEDSENDECIFSDENKMQVNKDDDGEQNDSNNRNEDSENGECRVLDENKMQENQDDGEQNDSNDRNEDSVNDECRVLDDNKMQVNSDDDGEQNDSNDINEDSENDKCRVLDENEMQVNIPDDDEQNDSNDRNEDSENYECRVLDENKMQVNKDDGGEENDSNHRNEEVKAKSNKKVKLSIKVVSRKKDGAKKKPERKKRVIDESKLLDETMFTVTALGLQEQLDEVRRQRGMARQKKASYRCSVCGLGFRRRGRYDAHVARHSELAGAFECSICARRQRTAPALQRHLAAFHSRRYSCNQCSFVTQNRNTARDHQARHKGVKFQCPHCPCEFDSRSTYVGHLRWKHRADFICELCGYTFLSARGVAMHKNSLHRFADENMPLEGPYCKTCDVTFFSEDAHDRHLKFSSRHSDKYDLNQIRNDPHLLDGNRKSQKIVGRIPEIESCDATDKDGTSGNKEVVSCEHCASEFPDFRLYAQHIRFMHPGKIRTQFSGKSETIMCDQCGRIFQSTNVLRDHMLTHTGSKLFQCDHCNKKYDQKTDLIHHIMKNNHGYWTLAYSKTRKQPRKYACSICDKQFNNAGNRIKHMWTHTALKPFKCESCDKTFAYQSILRTHFKNQHLEKTLVEQTRKTSSGKRRRKTKAPVED